MAFGYLVNFSKSIMRVKKMKCFKHMVMEKELLWIFLELPHSFLKIFDY